MGVLSIGAVEEVYKLLSQRTTKQFISYFGVGGAAALIEWGVFSLLAYTTDIPYLMAAVLAFIVSTSTNWYLGQRFTFKDSKYHNQKAKEIVLVFAVSVIGLVFNLMFMYLFVDIIGMKTSLMKTIAKIISTGIVFIWNFLSRKLWVYKA